MPHFLFAYHGGKMLETEAETEAEIARCKAGLTISAPQLSIRAIQLAKHGRYLIPALSMMAGRTRYQATALK
jgi:hypothetical protein